MNPDRDLYSGLIRLHMLHHAVSAPIFGLGMLEELARHGYRISPGTLYPLLHGLEQKGYLRSWEERNGRSRRSLFRATPKGHQAEASNRWNTPRKVHLRSYCGSDEYSDESQDPAGNPGDDSDRWEHFLVGDEIERSHHQRDLQ